MRFHFKLLVLFLLLFIFSASLLILFYNQIRNEISNAVQQDLERIVHSVHFSSSNLSNEKKPDHAFLSHFIDSLKNNSKVQEISIAGNNNRIAASSNPRKVGNHQTVNDQIVIVKETFGSADSAGKHERYKVTVPIVRDKKLVGLVQTGIIINNVESIMNDLFLKDAVIAVIFLFLLFIVFYEAFRRLNLPVSQLVLASKRIAEGEKFVQVQYENKGELRKLIHAFNFMAEKIEEQRSIEEQYRDLERKAILSETAAILAHEIRNPLNCINLNVDVLIDNAPEGEDRDMLVTIKQEVQRLNKMVTDFLAMGKPMPLSKSIFRVLDLINEVAMLIKRQLTDNGIYHFIEVDQTLEIYADREQMRLVLLNLLLNAIQASNKSGRILLSSKATSCGTLIKVSDNGCGITKENLQKIFNSYFTTKADGAGLGLALVKRIVEKHSGTIKVESDLLNGTTFEICIPDKREI